MTTLFPITQAERACWQRRATARLAEILKANPELPLIAWTVGTAGATLAGRVNGLAAPGAVRATFDAWRIALALTEHTETPSDSRTFLRAVAYRDRIQLGISATIFDDEGEDR